MKADHKKLLGLSGALLLFAAAGWAIAQDEATPAAAEEAVSEVTEAAPEAADKPAAAIKPRPSELMPLAPRSLMLGLATTGKVLVAVGERGHIIVSKDGKSWAQVQAPARSALTAVAFADEKNGWAVGHDAVIVHTADGGKTWTLQNFEPELEKPFLSVLFLDANTGFAVGAYGLLKKTTDAGKTWLDVDAPEIRADELHFNAIVRLNDGSLFIAGEQGMLGHSTDGGNTWKKLSSPYDASLFGALPVGDKGTLIFGLRGNAYLSTDTAAGNWTKVETGTVSSFFGGAVLNTGELAMVGLNGLVLVTDANGSNVRTVKVKVKELDKNGKEQMNVLSSTLSAAIPFGSGLVLVGEQGVQSVASVQ